VDHVSFTVLPIATIAMLRICISVLNFSISINASLSAAIPMKIVRNLMGELANKQTSDGSFEAGDSRQQEAN
jgi:hypothetical protein